ncbi:hypothetical protein ACFXKI_00820 [Streptomyces mirabilis]|uniref:hypothetical protein n=1 Tax=Streptomyces mirabilis TaxID=68239 RepID=UPI0036822ECA
MNARTNTPDVITHGDDGQSVTRTIKLKRSCNGCGTLLGDVDNRDIDDRGELTDVRAECGHCRPLVDLEAAGCKTWHVTRRTIGRVDDDIDRLGVYAKGYWQDVDGKLTVVGLRVGTGETRVVAFFGDWLIRHPDGTFATHKAPAEVSA